MTNQSIPQSTVKFQGKNEYFITGDTAEMVLYDKHGNEKDRCLIDAEDIPKCSDTRWSLLAGYVTHTKANGGKQKCIRLQNVVYGFSSTREILIDHRDRNTLNNRKTNLRICTRRQNLINNSQAAGESGYRGVYPSCGKGRYRARIRHNDHLYQVGTFDTPTEAAIAWNAKALELRGEFAVLNEV